MKDVSDILAKRLKMLENPFSRDWLSDFSFFMEFIQTNSLTIRIISSFTEEKEKAYASIIKNLNLLLKDGRDTLQEILQIVEKQDNLETLQKKIQDLQKTKIDRKRISDPFFRIESIYNDYVFGFTEILEQLSPDNENASLIDDQTPESTEFRQENTLFSLSPSLKDCNKEIEIFICITPPLSVTPVQL
jgi:hypothetical protein